MYIYVSFIFVYVFIWYVFCIGLAQRKQQDSRTAGATEGFGTTVWPWQKLRSRRDMAKHGETQRGNLVVSHLPWFVEVIPCLG